MATPREFTAPRQALIEERIDHARFAREAADERYRPLLRRLLEVWVEWNDQFFDGKLFEPHVDFANVPPRSLVTCRERDGSGAEMLITLKDSLVFGTHPDVVRPLPSEGMQRFIEDLFLRGILDQYVLEGLDPAEREKHSHDALYAREANRVGVALGLGSVVDRNRPGRRREPLAKHWPCCVREADYYQGDLSAELEDLARGTDAPAQGRPLITPSLGILEFLHFLLAAGRADEARRILERHLHWLRRLERNGRRQPRPANGVEEGSQDTDGTPLGEVCFDPAWLRWNGGTVPLIARSIRKHHTYAELPILADALEEAGCKEGRLLRHLRGQVLHNRNCWALRFVLALDKSGDESRQAGGSGHHHQEQGDDQS
jgi:hypothetical protein